MHVDWICPDLFLREYMWGIPLGGMWGYQTTDLGTYVLARIAPPSLVMLKEQCAGFTWMTAGAFRS